MEKLNNREIDVMSILWSTDIPLSVNEISEKGKISKNTVSPIIKKLLGKNLIKVEDVFMSGKNLTRKYKPLISREEFVFKQYKGLNIEGMVNYFLKKDKSKNKKEEIMRIDKLIREHKNKIK